MNSAEIEFVAENELIEILCTFNLASMSLISMEVGPFRAGMTTLVPLWLALLMKQLKLCSIVPPQWMNVEVLSECRTAEKSARNFTKMPSNHYMEITKLLLTHAPADIIQADKIRTIVKDIWDIRMTKIRNSAQSLMQNSSTFAQLDYLTRLEINSMVPLIPESLTQLLRIKQSADRIRRDTQFSSSSFFSSSNS